MRTIIKRKVQKGVYWIEIPGAGLKILCGCPADSIKHLIKLGYVASTKKNGVLFETGPNAILLSDHLVQNGFLSNLSEFPVLHMFYNQGMILPKHPNNTGSKPILIGDKKQVDAQMAYIFRGNYGLVSEEEYLEMGESKKFAQQNIMLKSRFAFGRFSPSEEMLDAVHVEREFTEIRAGAKIRKIKSNTFEIQYQNKSVTIDLNLKSGKKYRPTYRLPKIRLRTPHFGVVHIGEGNGWAPDRPCASSMIVYNKKLFLIDAGPNITYSLERLGVKPTEIDGIFFTHAHDDHFAGLYSLLLQNPNLKIYATRVILSTIIKKYAALCGLVEKKVEASIHHKDLIIDLWNEYFGMLVKPILSPHSIDTTIFIFKVIKECQEATYGHFSDITALDWLEKLLVDDSKRPGITREYLEYTKKNFQLKLTVKKVDVGGPIIHGDEKDFVEDCSDRLILTHTTQPLTRQQLKVGDQVAFGEMDTLIK